ncbi:hypothetical protein RCL1_005063 [Eukaryota sp. TZLM3-RCL]
MDIPPLEYVHKLNVSDLIKILIAHDIPIPNTKKKRQFYLDLVVKELISKYPSGKATTTSSLSISSNRSTCMLHEVCTFNLDHLLLQSETLYDTLVLQDSTGNSPNCMFLAKRIEASLFDIQQTLWLFKSSGFMADLHHVIKHDGYVYVVFEYYEACLSDLLRKRLSDDQIWAIFSQILIGVDELHQLGVYGLCICTNNFWLDSLKPPYKLKFFDIITTNSMVSSTDLYLSPECFTTDYSPESVDIWRIGVVLYILVERKMPFNSALEIITGNVVIPAGEFSLLLNQILNTDPTQRPSIAELCSHFRVVEYLESEHSIDQAATLRTLRRDVASLKDVVANLLSSKQETVLQYEKTNAVVERCKAENGQLKSRVSTLESQVNQLKISNEKFEKKSNEQQRIIAIQQQKLRKLSDKLNSFSAV